MKVIVNDIEVDLPPGTSALDAVFHAGFDVPYFCSNEYLSPIGACRMCLVEAGSPRKNPDGSWIMDEATGQAKIFYFPNPMASCTLAISEGMVIKTKSEVVVQAQAGMMEFTLLNHPLDCPTCDKGGACELQDRAYEYGWGEARFEFTRRHADKHHALSDFIVLDKERCIHCKRCVRYFEEIPGEEVLDFIERGSHTFIDSYESKYEPYESSDLAGKNLGNFSGNINDLCPVGALLDNTSRFRGRNWEYAATPTICTSCSVGCSSWVDARTGRIERIRARENAQINEIWLCDAGRFGHEWVDADERGRTPLVRRNGRLEPASWDEAVAAIRTGLSSIKPKEIGLYSSSDITLEEGIALERFAAQLGTPHLDHFPRYEAPIGGVRRATLNDIAHADAIIIVGADVSEEAPILDLRIQEMLKGLVSEATYNHGQALADLRLQERMPRKRERLAVFTPIKVRLSEHAGIADTYPIGGEFEILQTLARLKNDPQIEEKATPTHTALGRAAALLGTAKRAVLILGHFALAKDAARVLEAARQLGVSILPIPAGANAAGLELLELTPGSGGTPYGGANNLHAALFSGLEPDPALLAGLKFSVLHHTQLPSALAERIDVFLPAQSNFEKQGTFVNLEGRFLPLQAAAVDSAGSLELTGAINLLADALERTAEIRGTRSAQRLLAERFALDFANLGDGLIPQKTPRKTAMARLGGTSSETTDPGQTTRTTVLLVPRMWHERMLTKASQAKRAVSETILGLSSEVAKGLGLVEGETVEVKVNGRTRPVRVHVREGISTLSAREDELAGILMSVQVLQPVGGD